MSRQEDDGDDAYEWRKDHMHDDEMPAEEPTDCVYILWGECECAKCKEQEDE